MESSPAIFDRLAGLLAAADVPYVGSGTMFFIGLLADAVASARTRP